MTQGPSQPAPGRFAARVPAWAAPVAVAAAAVVWCTAAAVLDPTAGDSPLPSCPVKALTGWSCPGCGSTRMLHALAHGDVGAAVGYNAVALAVLPLLAWAWLGWLLRTTGRRSLPRWELTRWAVPVMVVVTVTWAVVRNLPFAPFTALAV